MSHNPIIAVDIDGTALTEISWEWWYHLKTRYTLKPEFLQLKYNWKDVKLPYNLTELFDFSEETSNGFEFWDNISLYDHYYPREDASEYLEKLSDEGFDIIFASKVCGNHGLSKTNFIAKHFPYAKACILTGDKQYIKCDVLVDDYVHNLNLMPANVACYRFRQDFSQREQPTRNMQTIYGFKELYTILTTTPTKNTKGNK
jgi:5'(3')-deoxyribonucleotidase